MILICDDKLLAFALMLLTTVLVECEKILTFTAHERGKVELRCPYEPGFEKNKKYLCIGACIMGFKNIPVVSGSPAEDERFSLTDDKTARVFTVTITDLRAEDGGQYWCGIMTIVGQSDDYTKIDLKVKHLSRVSAVSGQNQSITCRYNRNLKNGLKFMCKGSDPTLCVTSAIKVSSEMSINGKFSLKDDQSKGVFTVSIRDLTQEDSGIYWCGAVERQTHTWISATEINVSNVSPEEPSPTETTTASFRSSKPTETAFYRATTSSSQSTSSLTSSSSTSSSQTTLLLLLFPSSANDVLAETESGFTVNILVIILTVTGTLTGFAFALFLYLRRRQKKEEMQPVILLKSNHLPNGDLQTNREGNHGGYEGITNTLNHPD